MQEQPAAACNVPPLSSPHQDTCTLHILMRAAAIPPLFLPPANFFLGSSVLIFCLWIAFPPPTHSTQAHYYQSGWCPGGAWGPGGSSAAQARVGKGPRCTPYAVPVPASSARSDRPIPHRLHGIKHPLTNAGPSLKRTRTPSCTNHSDDRARAHWPTAPKAVGKHRGDDRRRLGRPPNDQHRAVPPLIHRAPETPRR